MKAICLVAFFSAFLYSHGQAMMTGENDHVTVEIRPWAQSFSHYDRPSFVITVQNHGTMDVVIGMDRNKVNVAYYSLDGTERYRSLYDAVDFSNPHGTTIIKAGDSIEVYYADLLSGEEIDKHRGLYLEPGVYKVRLFVDIMSGDKQVVEKSAECYVSIGRGSEEELMQLGTIAELRKGCQRASSFVDRVATAMAGDQWTIKGSVLSYIVSCIARIRSMTEEKQYYNQAIAYMKSIRYQPGVDFLEGEVLARKISYGRYNLDD